MRGSFRACIRLPLSVRLGQVCERGVLQEFLGYPSTLTLQQKESFEGPFSEAQASIPASSPCRSLGYRNGRVMLEANASISRVGLSEHWSGRDGRGTPPSSTRRTLFAENGDLLLGNSVAKLG